MSISILARIATALLVAGALALSGAKSARGPESVPSVTVPPAPAPAVEVDARLAQASTRFSIDLLKQVHKGENTFLSPSSAAMVLALTANGARGETQAAMLKSLGFDSAMSMAEINQANAALQTIVANPDPKVQVAMANGIWYQEGLTPSAAFVDEARTHYGAEVAGVRFGTAEATQTINNWVLKQTRSRIPKLFEETSPNTSMILVNALWFKGSWAEPFDPALTREHPFTRPDGSQKQVELMQQSGYWAYLKVEGLQAIRIPYGEGRVSLYVFLPDQLDGFMRELSPERWEDLINQFRHQRGTVGLPRLKLEYQAELLEPLAAMGMGPALGPGADFSGLFESGASPAIGRVVQKSFLEMNEEGTEAAAATGVSMVTSAPVDPPFQMMVDRPYLIAIRDDRTGVILFIGAIVEP